MTDARLETELKLDIDGEDRARLLKMPLLNGGFGHTEHLVSTYYDTPAGALRRAGFSLRVRHHDGALVQTIKADGAASAGLFVRPEWEQQLTIAQPVLDDASGPLIHILDAQTFRWVERRFDTDVHRTRRTIATRRGAVEVVSDEGEIIAGARRCALVEVELELQRGSPRMLFALARAINRDVPVRLCVMSKAERGYQLLAETPAAAVKAEPIALKKHADCASALQLLGMSGLRHFRRNEDIIRQRGDAEAVHQARVALRRLRSLLRLCAPLLEGDPRPARLRREMRWLATQLGEVRALDILPEMIAAKPPKKLADARAHALAHARVALASPRTRRLMLDLAEWLAVGRWRMDPKDPDALGGRAKLFARMVLDHQFRRLGRHGRGGLAAMSAQAIHQVRIDAKRLRYATDFFGSLFHSRRAQRHKRKLCGALDRLQDSLGKFNDAIEAPALLEGLGQSRGGELSGTTDTLALVEKAAAALAKIRRTKRYWRSGGS